MGRRPNLYQPGATPQELGNAPGTDSSTMWAEGPTYISLGQRPRSWGNAPGTDSSTMWAEGPTYISLGQRPRNFEIGDVGYGFTMADDRVRILERTELLRRGFFRWNLLKVSVKRFDGKESEPYELVIFDRGESVAMLAHDLVSDEIILVEQIRVAALGATDGWMLELPAGRIDDGEDPAAAAKRELKEEIGAEPTSVVGILSFYPSPGACSERLHLFYCPFENGVPPKEFGGLEAEHEDIRIRRLPLDEAQNSIQSGQIIDAKTIIGLQYLATRGERLTSPK